MDETHLSATRLGPPGSLRAPLRCGCTDIPAGIQRAFRTPQYACCWIMSGSGIYRDASGRSWPLAPGQVFQRFPGQRHDVTAHRTLRIWYVAVPGACLAALREIGLSGLDAPVIDAGQDRQLRQRFARTARRLRSAPEAMLAGCMAEMVGLIADLHRLAAPSAEQVPHRQQIETACRLLADDPARRWAVAGLARSVGLGQHAFRKSFARRLGCGPLAWQLRLRLERAQELLQDPATSIAAVASAVGYADPSQFCAIFRRHCGLSPRRWRTG